MLTRTFTLIVLLCTPLLVFAAGPAAPILPDQFGNWRAEAPAQPVNTQDFAPNFSKILQESGQKQSEQRVYKNGSDEITLRAFRLHDPSSAFELYTFLLAPGMKAIHLGEQSVSNGAKSVFQVGDVVLQADLPATINPDALQPLFEIIVAKTATATIGSNGRSFKRCSDKKASVRGFRTA